MFVQDRLTLDKTWDTPDGFLGFSARFARTGIQHYRGAQIDPEGIHKDAAGDPKFQADKLYPVQRDAAEVFAPRAMGSFIAKPITNDHPTAGVNADNWQRLAKGAIGEVLRDGEYARMSGLITDKATIADYRAGKRELSGGYQTQLIIGDGQNDKGEAYVARQTAIDGNHVALVDAGRAGPECAISDSVAVCDANPAAVAAFTQEKPVKTMQIDGLTVDVSNPDTAVATIQTLIAARDGFKDEADKAKTDLAAKDTEIATLKTEKKALEDAKPTPAQLRDAAKGYAQVCDKAKALGVAVSDEMDEASIMKAVVTKVMGDDAKDWNDAQIAASFAVATKDAKPAVQRLGTPIVTKDALTDYQDGRNKQRRALSDAWKTPFNPADAAAA